MYDYDMYGGGGYDHGYAGGYFDPGYDAPGDDGYGDPYAWGYRGPPRGPRGMVS